MSRSNCIIAAQAATKGGVSQAQATQIVDELLERAERLRADTPGRAFRAALKEAAAIRAGETEAQRFQIERLRVKSAETRLKRIEHYRRYSQGEEWRGLSTLQVGSEDVGLGRGLSVDALTHGLRGELKGEPIAAIRKAGLASRVFSLFTRDKDWELRVATEMARISDPAIPATGDASAMQLAAIYHKAMQDKRARFNEKGAWIGDEPGYVTRQTHDPLRVRGGYFPGGVLARQAGRMAAAAAAFEKWRSVIEPRLADRTFEGVPDRNAFLRAVWEGLATGEHLRHGDKADAWLNRIYAKGNLARRVSEARVLHFKDVKAWFDYNEQFGSAPLHEAVFGELSAAAKDLALMEVWGPSPRAAFEADQRMLAGIAARRGDTRAVDRINSPARSAEFDIVSGVTDSPAHFGLAAIGEGVRAQQRASKLGGILLSTLSDLGLRAAVLKHNGIGFLKGYTTWLDRWIDKVPEADRLEAMDEMLAGVDGMLGALHAGYAESGLSRTLNKGSTVFFKASGFTTYMDIQRRGAGEAIVRKLAREADKPFNKLPDYLRTTMQRYGFTAAEWDAIRVQRSDVPGRGRSYLTPTAVDAIPDAKMAELAGRDIAATQSWAAGTAARLAERIDELQDRVAKVGDAINALPDSTERTEIAAVMKQMEVYRKAPKEKGAASTKPGPLLRLMDELNRLATRPDKLNSVTGQLRRIMETLSRREFQAGAVARGAYDRVKAQIEKRAGLQDKFEAMFEAMAALTNEAGAIDTARLAREETIIRDARRNLRTRMQTYITDQILDTSTEPRAREKFYLTWGGSRRGTKLGEMARSTMLFKSFPITAITRHLNREWQRSIKRGHFGPIVHLMAATTILGAFSMSLRAMVQGKEPPDFAKPEVFLQAFSQGGGLGIYGDFLLGDFNRFGASMAETALGPLATTFGSMGRAFSAAIRGEDWKAQALKTAIGEVPFLNLFYTKIALDYAFLYQLQEMMNPGYLQRMERRLLKDRGQTFFKPPSEAIPKGGGDRFLEGLRE